MKEIKKRPPNLLFIMTDEQKYDTVGYRNPEVHTPNLDRLAKQSVVFQNAYTTNPSCIPARAAIFTGRYPSQCGAPCYITPLSEKETTFMRLLQQGGYETAVIGKQHFWTSLVDKGYDYMDIVDEHGPPAKIGLTVDENTFGQPQNLTVSDHVSSYVSFLYQNGFRRGSELYELEDETGVCRWKVDEKYYVDSYIGDRGVEWLQNHPVQERPWFLTLSFPGPHMPFDGIGLPEEKLYCEEELSLPQTAPEDLLTKPPHYLNWLEKFAKVNTAHTKIEKAMTEKQLRHLRLSYYANMSLIDRKIGEILQVLKEKGEYDNTLIVFTSDHGDFMGEFGMAMKAQYLSEALMRVPLLLKPPIVNFKGKTESSLVSTVELAATFLTAANLPLPTNISQRSLTQFYESEQNRIEWKTLYMEARDLRAIRDERYKLIYYASREYGELYDLQTDPVERHNLWSEPAYLSIRRRLEKQLLDQLIFLGEGISFAWNEGAPSI